MRPFYYLPLLTALVACESDISVAPATVEWMEWPAEVSVAAPFPVRLIVSRPGCYQGLFKPGTHADESAVTFAPYFLVNTKHAFCPPGVYTVYPNALDIVVTAPGLGASFARTFEMRAAAQVYAPTPSANTLPVRTYGDVTVRLAGPDSSRRNAAGFAAKDVDNLGCVRVRPNQTIRTGYVLEDQADTARFSYAFVRGYIHASATPICGETRVFELVSRN